MPARVLLVEDEEGLRITLTDLFESEGYEVATAADGEEGLGRALNESFDLIILDWMLPKKTGLDVCRELRQSDVGAPILMLTARSQTIDKVLGLQLGADDYLTKPFESMELLARMMALLRRVPLRSGKSGSFEFGDVRVDFRRAEVRKAGAQVNLSAREFRLLEHLIEHRGEALTREELLDAVWGYQPSIATRTVDVHMTWLRQKVEDNPKVPRYLTTVRGAGYRFDA